MFTSLLLLILFDGPAVHSRNLIYAMTFQIATLSNLVSSQKPPRRQSIRKLNRSRYLPILIWANSMLLMPYIIKASNSILFRKWPDVFAGQIHSVSVRTGHLCMNSVDSQLSIDGGKKSKRCFEYFCGSWSAIGNCNIGVRWVGISDSLKIVRNTFTYSTYYVAYLLCLFFSLKKCRSSRNSVVIQYLFLVRSRLSNLNR